MSNLTRMAICYDFDRTLSPDDMQSFTFIPSVGMQPETFFAESNAMARANHMDRNLAWMKKMIDEATRAGQSIQRSAFQALGRDVSLFPGVDTWFARVNAYATSHGMQMEHYVISSGLKEIVEGSAIAGELTRIYASTFLYAEDGSAIWPAQVVNYTNKTQFIFRIAKGALDENDDSVNRTMDANDRYVPYQNMVYIGDSETDIPSMRVVKSKGGFAVGVYDPSRGQCDMVCKLFAEDRIDLYAPTDYRADAPLFGMICRIIDLAAARAAIAQDRQLLHDDLGKN